VTNAAAPMPQWYDVVTESEFRQGDILQGIVACWLPAEIPGRSEVPADGEDVGFDLSWAKLDLVVMSASCDIVRGNPQILLARVLPATEETLKVTGKQFQERLEVMSRGQYPARFLLSPHSERPDFPLSYVEYSTQFLLPLDYVRRVSVGARLRMRHPFREWFGTWAGNNLGRVAIEDEHKIPSFTGGRLYDAQALRALDG
jgi:hypothetical protein